jgi:hypothetical protein
MSTTTCSMGEDALALAVATAAAAAASAVSVDRILVRKLLRPERSGWKDGLAQ